MSFDCDRAASGTGDLGDAGAYSAGAAGGSDVLKTRASAHLTRVRRAVRAGGAGLAGTGLVPLTRDQTSRLAPLEWVTPTGHGVGVAAVGRLPPPPPPPRPPPAWVASRGGGGGAAGLQAMDAAYQPLPERCVPLPDSPRLSV